MAGKNTTTFTSFTTSEHKDGEEHNVSCQFVATDFGPVFSETYVDSSHESGNGYENTLRGETAQKLLEMGFLPTIIKRAIDRINGYQGQFPVITPEALLDEIEKIRNEENVPASKLKRPMDADNLKNSTVPRDPEDLRKENHEMRQMLLCKACKMVDISHVILSCGHMLCEGCLKNLKICWSCKSEIGKVHKVRFDRE